MNMLPSMIAMIGVALWIAAFFGQFLFAAYVLIAFVRLMQALGKKEKIKEGFHGLVNAAAYLLSVLFLQNDILPFLASLLQ